MISSQIDARGLTANMTNVELQQFPFALVNALNETAYQVREAWQDKIPQVFDRPTAVTMNAVVYDKATKDRLYAVVGLKGSRGGSAARPWWDYAGYKISPAQYLAHNVQGGERPAKKSEVLLRRAGVLGPNEYIAPAEGMAVDEHGNIKGGVIQGILSDLQASFDDKNYSSRDSRRRRLNRGSRTGGKRGPGEGGVLAAMKEAERQKRGAVYFYNRQKRGRLPRGIFQRVLTGFGHALRMALAIVSTPKYPARFDVFGYSQRVWDTSFPRNFKLWMERAMATRR